MKRSEPTLYSEGIQAAVIIIGMIILFAGYQILTAPPAPESPAPNITESYVIVETPTPTPVPTRTLTIQQEMAATNGLPLGRYVSYRRENVSGLKDIAAHIAVTGYREFGSVQVFNASWGRYWREGAGNGMKFIFVFLDVYSDEGSARTWGIQPEQFALAINGQTYNQTQILDPAFRVKDLDEVIDKKGQTIQPYGYLRYHPNNGPEKVERLGYLKAGQSNRWTGYIVFSVPYKTKMSDVRVLGSFGSLVEPHWWSLA